MHRPYFPAFWDRHEKKLAKLRTQVWWKKYFLYEFKLDADGIIYTQQKLFEGRKRIYNPITIIQAALDLYNERNYARFKQYTEKLLTMVKFDICHGTKLAYLEMTQPMKIAGYRFPRRWKSAMYQGMALSVLMRYYPFAPKKTAIIRICNGILNTFALPVNDGGVLDIDQGDWYEEFCAKKRAHVLNGFIYALLGLYEYAQFAVRKDPQGSKQAQRYFDRGILTLEQHLPRFNLKTPFFKWSRYDDGLLFFAGTHYHNTVHIPQLKILHEITQKKIFHVFYKRWKHYAVAYGGIMQFVNFPILFLLKMRGLLRV